MKLIAQRCLKLPVMLNGLVRPKKGGSIAFLIYHSVAGHLDFELDLPLPLFRRQLEFLANTKRVISYEQALELLQAGKSPTQETFVLTFDDGFDNFYIHVFPLLQEFQLPVILFATTGFVETGTPYPILNRSHAGVRPVKWDMLAEMVESGLVTVGAHTHTHPVLVNETKDRVIEELEKPIEIFQRELGIKVRHFAYPKALWNRNVEALVSRHYQSAVICDEKKATPENFNPYRIPRIPIRRSDGWVFFLAKIRGWLEGEEAMYDKLRLFRDSRRRVANDGFRA